MEWSRVAQAKQSGKTRHNPLLNTRLALPDNQHSPAICTEGCNGTTISRDVRLELGTPELHSGLRHVGHSASRMPVPEAAMHKDDEAVLRQDNVRSARQVLSMQAEAVSKSVQSRPHNPLRARVLGPDPGHVLASLLGCQAIHAGWLTSSLLGCRRQRSQRSGVPAAAALHYPPAGTAPSAVLRRSSCPGTSGCVRPPARSDCGIGRDQGG
jgi:hypothetical protein